MKQTFEFLQFSKKNRCCNTKNNCSITILKQMKHDYRVTHAKMLFNAICYAFYKNKEIL